MSEPAGASASAGPWVDRGWYLVIEFQQSSSARFDKAVQIASKNPGFQVLIDEAGRCIYRVLYRPEQLDTLAGLLHLVEGWKETRCYVRGAETALDTLYCWLACFLQRRRQKPADCRRPLSSGNLSRHIGCSFAGVWLGANDWDAWYHYGEMGADGVFRVDKARLAHQIDSWRHGYAACPYADEGLLRRVVAALPDTIDVRLDKHWTTASHFYRGVVPAPRSRAAFEEFLRRALAPLLDKSP